MPAAPALLVFVGGGGAWDGTFWAGGPANGDGLPEGIIRQAAGLLDGNGKPISPVPGAQQIIVGGNTVGFTGNNYKAYNLGVTTFATAWGSLKMGDNVYVFTHGSFSCPGGKKGGVIFLDSDKAYNGFVAPGFPQGTNADTCANPPVSAYPALPANPGGIHVWLHACFSGANPGGPGQSAVSTTLGAIPGVAISHSHLTTALGGLNDVVVNNGGATQAQLAAAQAAIDNFATQNQPFDTQYSQDQATADAAVGAGLVTVQITYGDTGNGADPDKDAALCSACTACSSVGGVGVSIPVDKLASLAPYIGYALVATTATVLTAVYLKRFKSKRTK